MTETLTLRQERTLVASVMGMIVPVRPSGRDFILVEEDLFELQKSPKLVVLLSSS